MPLVEGAIVSILKQYNGDFGFQRIYGSLGPLIMTPLSGLLIDTFSGYSGSQDYRWVAGSVVLRKCGVGWSSVGS